MPSNKGVTIWLPFKAANELLEKLEQEELTPRLQRVRERLREQIAQHRLGYTRRPKQEHGEY